MHVSRQIVGSWVWTISMLLLGCFRLADGFSWKSDMKMKSSRNREGLGLEPTPLSAPQLLQTGSGALSARYEVALQELKQLEAEPLCHRTAARLLVNNCQLLEGKDDATMLTDSGRQIQDFVDACATSLAICDLERGSFVIPKECTKFRESELSQISLRINPQLHVTSKEIDSCLSGLGASDPAWNTYISYRHKTLRFCEAARADNEKANHIRLFQNLTRIMSKLTNGVEETMDRHMEDINSRAQLLKDHIDLLWPRLDHLMDGVNDVEALVSVHLPLALKKSADTINDGVENAANLQKMLGIMLSTILSTSSEVASAHENSLQLISRRAESELSVVRSALAATVASASTLQNQIELSRLQATELEQKQDSLEHGMQRLLNTTERLSATYEDHTILLQEAQRATNEILQSLEDTATTAALVSGLFSEQRSAAAWWPYIWCPAVSLVMGSYGLPPSGMRNLALVALGEIVGFAVSSLQFFSFDSIYFPVLGRLSVWVPYPVSNPDSAVIGRDNLTNSHLS